MNVIIAAALVLSAWILSRRERHSAGVDQGGMWAPQLPPMEYPTSPEGNPVEPSEVPVRHDTPLRPGSRVLAFQQERWWRAEVIRLEPGGQVRIQRRHDETGAERVDTDAAGGPRLRLRPGQRRQAALGGAVAAAVGESPVGLR